MSHDPQGNTLEFLLSPPRDAEAAKRFFLKALPSTACSAPQTCPIEEQMAQPMAPADSNTTTLVPCMIKVDKHAADPQAIAELKAAGMLPESVEVRQGNSLNTLVEYDHRFLKRLVKPGMGFFPFQSSWRTLQGYEVMNMIRKGQGQAVNKADSISQIAFLSSLFGVAA